MTTLRPYQEKDIAEIRARFMRGAARICYAAPTGSGKTVLFVHAARKAAERGQRVAIIVHRKELVDQTCAALAVERIEYGVIVARYAENPDRTCSSPWRRLWCTGSTGWPASGF